MPENQGQSSKKFVTLDVTKKTSAVLKVVGVGGGGCNAIESMIRRGLNGVEYVSINTDSQVLRSSSADHKIQIGTTITRGLGAGADPNIGKKAAEEDREKLTEVLSGADMVFINTGMGGGTGTGAAPVVASIAKSLGALVVGIVTKPFRWEGKKRMMNAEQGIQELKQYVDSLIVIPNERLLNILDKNSTISAAFDKPNDVLYEATRGIADIINVEGYINVDFADVRTVMNQSGEALMGCGIASGENRAIEAAQKAISSPLLEGVSIKGAKSILLNVTGSSNLTMQEINEGNNIIFEAAGEEASVIFGLVTRDEMNDYISYTVIATGFENNQSQNYTKATVAATAPKKKTEEKTWDRTGFSFPFKNGTTVDNEDLSIPTIMRVTKPNASMQSDNDNSLRSGFSFDNSNYASKPLKDSEEEEEDSSSFLKMIMD